MPKNKKSNDGIPQPNYHLTYFNSKEGKNITLAFMTSTEIKRFLMGNQKIKEYTIDEIWRKRS
jgi:hypothetical protein